MLNLKHLYYFYIYSKDLSTSKAAKRLQITSPALSNQLKQLEGILGAPLTRRSDGKAIVTAHGKMVLSYAEKMFSTYEDLKTELAASRIARTNLFRVGISQNISAGISLDVLSLFKKSNPSLAESLRVTFDSADKLLAGVAQDQFDLVLGAFNAPISNEKGWISHQFRFPVRLFAPRRLMGSIETPEARDSVSDLTQIISLANTHGVALALPTRPSILRDETDLLLSQTNCRPLKTIECNSSSGIMQLIELGHAFGFLPTGRNLRDLSFTPALVVAGPTQGYWTHRVSALSRLSEERTSETLIEPAEFLAFAPVQ